jgi:hypothetical protein
MMRYLIVFGALFHLVQLSAQNVLPVQMDTTLLKNEFIFSGQGEYSSNALQRQLTQQLLFGGYIDQNMKDLSFAKHRSANRVGGELGGELEYRNYTDTLFRPRFGWVMKAGYANYASAVYSKDLFGLAFYGNEQYLGTSAEFSGVKFNYCGWLKLGFGLIDKKSKSSVSLNVYGITNYAQGDIQTGSLYQTESGDSLHVDLQGTVDYTSSNTFLKGYGIGLDADIRIPVQIIADKISYVQILAKNLGVGIMTSPATRYDLNTSIGFKGFTFDELIGSSSLFSATTNWKDTLGIDSTSVKPTFFLPGLIQAGKMIDEMNPAKIQAFYGFRIYPSMMYNPLLYIGAHWKTTKWLNVGVHGSYGGYSGIRFGLYSQLVIKQIHFAIGSEDLLGFFSKKASGQSILFRLRCVF